MGIGYLIANTKGAEVRYVTSVDDLVGSDIIGLSSTAWGLNEAVSIAKKFKDKLGWVVLGGQGALWGGVDGFDVPSKHGFAYVVHGDGELAFQDIVDGQAQLGSVLCKRVEDLDSLNSPERGRCDVSIPIVTSRGCPFQCKFCSSSAQWGRKPRLRSAENIMEEVRYVAERYKTARELYIQDDLFAYPPKRFNALYEMWIAEGFHKRFRLRSFVRSNMATRYLFLKMKHMGFSRVRFGAESGSDRMLKLLGKGATVADHQRAIDLASSVGIQISASFMHDLPGETERDRQETRHFVARNCDKLIVEGTYAFKPFPGTELWDGESPLDTDMRVRPS
jgi:radical SAM superfamily enzyme YgiQ (UPF0313 family)